MWQNEERLLDFLDLTGGMMELCGCEHGLSSRRRRNDPKGKSEIIRPLPQFQQALRPLLGGFSGLDFHWAWKEGH